MLRYVSRPLRLFFIIILIQYFAETLELFPDIHCIQIIKFNLLKILRGNKFTYKQLFQSGLLKSALKVPFEQQVTQIGKLN